MQCIGRALSLSGRFVSQMSRDVSHLARPRYGGLLNASMLPFSSRWSFCLTEVQMMAQMGRVPLAASRSQTPQLPFNLRAFSTRNIGGRLFYKRRPKMVPKWKFNPRSKWLEGAGNRKGVCTKVFIQSPKKPNSGQKKVCYVRLSNGRVVKAYIPGQGHNLQVHSVVMVRGGRRRELIGCNLTCMRGQYDLLPVKNRGSKRSKYGVKRPNLEPVRARWKKPEHVKNRTTIVDRRLHFYRTGEMLDENADLSSNRFLPPRVPSMTLRRPKQKTT
ncbi:unnamed protein product [Durusdinium trenchii]|uniref:Uncharacterized protein n=2 Tax=Durusdinium trenchii TaxID=1381693 RepID=A0ABP0Q2Z6_9DINO